MAFGPPGIQSHRSHAVPYLTSLSVAYYKYIHCNFTSLVVFLVTTCYLKFKKLATVCEIMALLIEIYVIVTSIVSSFLLVLGTRPLHPVCAPWGDAKRRIGVLWGLFVPVALRFDLAYGPKTSPCLDLSKVPQLVFSCWAAFAVRAPRRLILPCLYKFLGWPTCLSNLDHGCFLALAHS